MPDRRDGAESLHGLAQRVEDADRYLISSALEFVEIAQRFRIIVSRVNHRSNIVLRVLRLVKRFLSFNGGIIADDGLTSLPRSEFQISKRDCPLDRFAVSVRPTAHEYSRWPEKLIPHIDIDIDIDIMMICG